MTGLLERDVLVISQKAKLIEMTNEYRILDPEGAEVGAIRQEGQAKSKKVFRFVTDLDQFLTHRLSVYEADGTKLLEIERPAKVFKSTLKIRDGSGADRGVIVQDNVLGKKHFSLRGPGGELLGWIDAENWRSWDFAIHDADEAEVGRITKQVGRHPPRRVHDGRSLHPADHRPDVPGSPVPARGVGGGPRHRAEAGRHRWVGLRRPRSRRSHPLSPSRSSKRTQSSNRFGLNPRRGRQDRRSSCICSIARDQPAGRHSNRLRGRRAAWIPRRWTGSKRPTKPSTPSSCWSRSSLTTTGCPASSTSTERLQTDRGRLAHRTPRVVQLVVGQNDWFVRGTTADGRSDPGDELERVERFGDVVVGSGCHPSRHV